MSAGPPHWYNVLIGCLAVVVGCAVASTAFWSGFRGGNWLLHIVGVGATLFVAGVVGQRVPTAATGKPGNIWETAIDLPATSLSVNQVTIVGLLVVLAGLSIVLFVEHVPASSSPRQPAPGAFEDDDSV